MAEGDPGGRATAVPAGPAPAAGAPGGQEPLLIELLTVAQRRLARGLAAALDEEGCTIDQWRVMRALGDGEGHPMGELATTLLIPQASLSRVVDALADSGWVYRRQSDEDRRRITAHLSRQGRRRLTRLDALAAAHDAAVREACGATDPGRALAALAAGPDAG
ncbi:MarR family winged helix-turn-helix transcriptional regulator [Kitasatospora sp. NPDC004240]